MTPTRSQVNSIVRDFGHTPHEIRVAITAMRRRGFGWKRSTEAVRIVNAAHAGSNYDDYLDWLMFQASRDERSTNQ